MTVAVGTRKAREAFTAGEWAEYDSARKAIAEKFETRGRGTQQRAAYDLRIHPSYVSQVLRGLSLHRETLDRLSGWVDLQPVPVKA